MKNTDKKAIKALEYLLKAARTFSKVMRHYEKGRKSPKPRCKAKETCVRNPSNGSGEELHV